MGTDVECEEIEVQRGRRVLKHRETSALKFCSASSHSPSHAATMLVSTPLTVQHLSALPWKKSKTACGNILECFWRQSWEKGRPVTRQDPVLLLLWLLCEYPAPLSPTGRNVGALKTSPGWLSHTETPASHRLQSAGVASLPPRLPHPHSRVANGVAREPPSAASKLRSHWPNLQKGKSAAGIGAQGRGVSPTCSQASAGYPAL
jgi:hypothetical protein